MHGTRGRRLVQRLSVALVTFVGLPLLGCGGGGGGGAGAPPPPPPPGGDVNPFVMGPITGQVARSELEGPGAPLALTLLTPYGRSPVGPDGSYAVTGFVNGPTPAMVVDADGTPRTFAFVAPSGGRIDNALAAKSLALVASKGMFLLPEVRARYWSNLGSAPEVGQAAGDLAGLGGHLAGDPAATQAVFRLRIGTLVARLGQVVAPQMRVTPPDGRSGITVLQQGLDDIVVVNAFRRRAHAFVERVAIVRADDSEEVRQDAIADFPVASVAVPSSLSAAVADAGTVLGDSNSAFTGNVAYVDTSTAPLHLDLLPADAKRTTYRVVAVGPGATLGTVANLTPAMESRLSTLWAETIGLDVLIPLFMNLAGPMLNKNLETQGILNAAEREQALILVMDMARLLLLTPTVAAAVEAGDIQNAISQCINTAMTSAGFASMRNQVITHLILSMAPNADADVVADFMKGLGKLLQWLDYGLQGADWVAIAAGIAKSSRYEEFLVDVTKVRVRLSPQAAKISVKGRETFTATVPDATGSEAPLVTYRFRLTSGTAGLRLENPTNGQTGTELGSSTGTMVVESFNHTVTTGALEVEAIVDDAGTANDYSLGTAHAVIHVVDDKAVLSPAKSSIRPDGSQPLRVRITNPDPGSQYMFRWSCTDGVGSIDVGTDTTSRSWVTYTSSGPLGSDTISVRLLQHGPGGLVEIGRSSATVLVEEEPTIVPATYRAMLNGLGGCYAIVSFARPAGFTSFRLVGVGGYDYAYWGESIVLGGGEQIPASSAIDLGAGNLGWGLSAGGSANPAEYIPWMDSRFGGFSFYVEASR